MPINFKQIAFRQNRAAMLKAFSGQEIDFNVCASIINLWFTSSPSRLSKKNVEFGKKHLLILRERTPLADLENQQILDRLDGLIVKALENIEKRSKAREIAAAETKVPQAVRPKRGEILPPSSPAVDPADIWARALEEKTS
jgi:hypothetical protein